MAPNSKTVAAKMIGVEKFFKNFRITELLNGPDVCLQAQSALPRWCTSALMSKMQTNCKWQLGLSQGCERSINRGRELR